MSSTKVYNQAHFFGSPFGQAIHHIQGRVYLGPGQRNTLSPRPLLEAQLVSQRETNLKPRAPQELPEAQLVSQRETNLKPRAPQDLQSIKAYHS